MLNKLFNKRIKDQKAKEVMVRHVITLSPTENLWKTQNTMSRYRIKKVVVTQNKKHPIGIVTLKDIIKFLISDKTDRDLDEIPISEAMTTKLVIADKNATIIECAKTMTTNNVSSLIIVEDDDNKNYNLAGLITSTGFANFFSENCIGFASVKDHMSQPIFDISIKEKVSTAAQIMSDKRVSRLIVIDPDNQNKLVGIISETDVSRTIPASKSRIIRSVYENIELLFSSKLKPDFIEPSLVRIRDIMTPNPITTEKDADLAEAAKIMVKQGISGLPVIESSDNVEKPVGIISKFDIIKALSTQEGEDDLAE
jgi:CBS domain-containing protein